MPGPEDIPCDKPVIYGDLMDRETRFILALLKLANEDHYFYEINKVEGG
jgi:hypothetical protein